ncbi:hypothetical protein VYF65_003473 [Lysinibacillus irui]|uniref:hypothetical protein n=1 Tax=Lysinibacillus irui TaxID=2998077 RepID=UPI0038872803
MKEAGLVSEEEVQALIELKETQANDSIKLNGSEGEDYLKSQSLSREYIHG